VFDILYTGIYVNYRDLIIEDCFYIYTVLRKERAILARDARTAKSGIAIVGRSSVCLSARPSVCTVVV